MASSKRRGPPPREAVGDPLNCRKLAGVDSSDHKPTKSPSQVLPSRSTLARRWPALRLNRYTGAWRDDASGAKGADVASLLSYIGGAR